MIYHVNNEFEFYQKLINIMLMYFMNKPHICKVEVWFLACCIYTNCRVVCEIENIPFKLYSPLSNSEQLLEKTNKHMANDVMEMGLSFWLPQTKNSAFWMF